MSRKNILADDIQLIKSLTYIQETHELISKQYDEFIQHITNFLDQHPPDIAKYIDYKNPEDGSLHLLFCRNELIFNYAFKYDFINRGRIYCHKKVDDTFILFNVFEYNDQGITTLLSDRPYRLNEKSHAVSIMLYLVYMSFCN